LSFTRLFAAGSHQRSLSGIAGLIVDQRRDQGQKDQAKAVDYGQVQAPEHFFFHGQRADDVNADKTGLDKGVNDKHLDPKQGLERGSRVFAALRGRFVKHDSSWGFFMPSIVWRTAISLLNLHAGLIRAQWQKNQFLNAS